MMKRRGYTLVEILIVVAIVVLLGLMVLIILNVASQMNKARDSKKITDLDALKKALEEYYNDRGCYPTLPELCYLGGDNGDAQDLSETNHCYICGTETQTPNFEPYLKELPCDPDHPKKKYIYYIEGDPSCPQAYKIYTDFNGLNNVGNECSVPGACGLPGVWGYDYGVSSDNTVLNVSPYFYCQTKTNTCDNCLYYQNCLNNSNCLQIYGTFNTCCELSSPKPAGCP